MKNWKYILLTVILFPLLGMVSSCSEDSETEGDFDNWEKKNEAVLNQWAANSSYRRILSYTLNDGCVTLRFRDTMEQERVAISELNAIIEDKVSIASLLKKLQ